MSAGLTVRVPLAIRRQPGRKTVVTPADEVAGVVRTRADPALLKALARAFRWQRMLDEGRYGSISELAKAEKIERGFLGKLLQLTLLAPWVVEAIVDGQQADEVSLPGLMEGVGGGRFGMPSECWSRPPRYQVSAPRPAVISRACSDVPHRLATPDH